MSTRQTKSANMPLSREHSLTKTHASSEVERFTINTKYEKIGKAVDWMPQS